VLAGAAVSYLAGWTFGTRELAALALVLALSVPLALAGVMLAARGSFVLTRRLPVHAIAGSTLRASVSVEPPPAFASCRLVERCPGLGDPAAGLVRDGTALTGTWLVGDPARGRYQLAPELVLEDPLGLVRAHVVLDRSGLVRVEPRLVELGPAYSPAISRRDGMRRAFAANAGDGLAGVRDHEFGESLRRVHWRTTARRGRLTVREVEEHPREDMLVLLDASRRLTGGGRVPAFECAVRAAGSLAVHAARSGIVVAFESTGDVAARVVVPSGGCDSGLLDALCAVEADGATPLAAALRRATASSLAVVTSDLGPAVVEQLRALRARHRAVTAVAVDQASWSGEPSAFAGAVAALARAGVEVVVLGRDDELAGALAPLVGRSVAHVV
jgi:uncharacterized protein (DUF58 family)